MNKNEIENILKDHIITGNVVERNYSNIETKLQIATKNSIVFYRVLPGATAEDVLKSRLSNDSECLLIINRKCPTIAKRQNTLVVNDFEACEKILCDHFYPLGSVKLAGVTGTNGKTTTVNVACQISKLLGKRTISIGTLGISNDEGKVLEDLSSTTPSYIELRRILNQYGTYDAIFLEVSSHGLDQNRLGNLLLDVGCWTSFSQDHLDYHKTMESYFKAKCLIFQKKLKINGAFYITKKIAPLFENVENNERLTVENVSDNFTLETLPPSFRPIYNQENLACAISIVSFLFGKDDVMKALKDHMMELITPKGRFSVLTYGANYVIIDYAHTPDALENICKATRDAFPGYELITVFGCGGNRDKLKRPIMGEIAERCSDYVFVTSDNPRYEDPDTIIAEIEKGMKSDLHTCFSYRRQAIRNALAMMTNRSIVLITGKGHEEYQEVKGVKRQFSDFDEVRVFMGDRRV